MGVVPLLHCGQDYTTSHFPGPFQGFSWSSHFPRISRSVWILQHAIHLENFITSPHFFSYLSHRWTYILQTRGIVSCQRVVMDTYHLDETFWTQIVLQVACLGTLQKTPWLVWMCHLQTAFRVDCKGKKTQHYQHSLHHIRQQKNFKPTPNVAEFLSASGAE